MTTSQPTTGPPAAGQPATRQPATGLLPRRGSPRMTPGRWVVLAIGVPIALVLIGATGFSVVVALGQASFPVSYAVPVSHGQLTASVGAGNITVRPSQGTQGTTAHLTGTVQYSLIRPRVTYSTTATGTTVGLRCRIPTGNCGLDATLLVPEAANVALSSDGGDITVSSLAASVNLSSEGGDIAVSGIGGLARVSTGGGDLTADDLAGIGQFSTSGGDINGGDLTAPSVNADSGGGDVTLVFAKPPANLDITSDGGDITVLLPHGSTGYNVTSSADGGDDSVSVPVSPSSKHTINVDSGGGDISIGEAS